MRHVRETPVSTGLPGTRAKIRIPEARSGTLRRRRLEDAIFSDALARRTTVLAAPAGFGKTTLLSEWARCSDAQCAWVSLEQTDDDPGELYRWIVAALQGAAVNLREPARTALLELTANPGHDPPADYRAVVRALEELSEPLSLVVDDVHRAGPRLAEGLLGTLLSSGPPALHLVLSSRAEPPLPLAARRLGGTVGDLRSRDLAFTQDETIQLLTRRGFDGQLEGKGLWNVTGGWPVAVAEGLAGRDRGIAPANVFAAEPRRAFSDYVAQEVLAPCPAPLADFILRATTRDRFSRELAIDLGGSDDGGLLLEHCLRDGIFLEETNGGGGPTYHWQPLFAATCRGILAHRDPRLAESLHGVAARHYRDVDVSACVSEALLGRQPRIAVRSIAEHWLELILQGRSSSLEQLCLRLPFPFSEDPEMLFVRSACRGIAGDRSSAAALGRRALAGVPGLGSGRRRRFEVNRALFELFVVGSEDADATVREGLHLVDRASRHPSASLAHGLFLLGRGAVRSPRSAHAASDLLQSAAAAGRANHLITVEVSAGAELALALAVTGDFSAAEQQCAAALSRAESTGWSCRQRLAPLGIARGIVAYWQDDLDRASRGLSEALEFGSQPFPADSLAMVYRVLVDCATGDPARVASAAAALQEFDLQPHDSSWPVLSIVCAAKLCEAAGDADEAAALVRPLTREGQSPLVDALVAQMLRRAQDLDRALACARGIAVESSPPFARVCGALTEALVAASRDDPVAAHERLEEALRWAAPESILRPFVERRTDLLHLLVRHVSQGTVHEAFVAACLAQHPPEHVLRREHASLALSEREREILVYLRSMLTAAEIADSLFVSVNTLKTHQRSIYRKLGVTNRRSAVRIGISRGLI